MSERTCALKRENYFFFMHADCILQLEPGLRVTGQRFWPGWIKDFWGWGANNNLLGDCCLRYCAYREKIVLNGVC